MSEEYMPLKCCAVQVLTNVNCKYFGTAQTCPRAFTYHKNCESTPIRQSEVLHSKPELSKSMYQHAFTRQCAVKLTPCQFLQLNIDDFLLILLLR